MNKYVLVFIACRWNELKDYFLFDSPPLLGDFGECDRLSKIMAALFSFISSSSYASPLQSYAHDDGRLRELKLEKQITKSKIRTYY